MAKRIAITFSAILILLGLFGFVSNSLIGANAFFEVNNATNWLHLILGAAIYIGTFA